LNERREERSVKSGDNERFAVLGCVCVMRRGIERRVVRRRIRRRGRGRSQWDELGRNI
jgi:hypothetical protein